MDYFWWTGDDDSTDEPEWLVADLESGRVKIENAGTPDVCLVIDGKRFPRFSVITRRDIEGI